MSEVIARALEARRAGDREGALALLRRALVEHPDSVELRVLVGGMLRGHAESAEAIAILEPTLTQLSSDKHAPILAALATSYDRVGRKADAIAACRRAIAIEGPGVATAQLLALLLGEVGELQESLALFRWLLPRVKPEGRETVERAIAKVEGWMGSRP